jgi:hypothetical protein
VWVNQIAAGLEAVWKNVMPALSVQLDLDPRPAHANAHDLTSVLEAILAHARQNMEAGASIWLDTSRKGRGGMSEHVCARVTYLSARETVDSVDRAFDPSGEGAWDGLPAAYAVARQMGAILTARHEGKHTVTFEIFLPTVDAASAGVPARSVERPVILLIEPDSAISGRLHEWFDRHGYNVLAAANCEEALVAAELFEGQIPLVIANPAEDDSGRAGLTATLQARRPGTCLRLFDGHWLERNQAGALPAGSAGGRAVDGPSLLEWANAVLGPARAQVSSGD